jgi:phosphoserine phosphatase RsbU/P
MTRSRILVVDDEPGMLHAVERVLGTTYDIVALGSSRAALATARELKPHLAIVDIRMPEMDGFELMAQLQAESPDLQIILMTGSIDDLDEKLIRALRSPAFYFIQKPFDRDVLKTLVERCLELQWRREQHRRQLERLETEMAEARAFQQSLLPEPASFVNGLAISCRYIPWRGMGGDLCDYAAAGGQRTALLIADVSGHGVSAAMLTGVVKSAFHAARAEGYEPLSVIHRAWNALAAFGPERFVTLVAALVAPAERQLRYVNAGHPACVVWGNGRDPVWMASTGPLVSPALAPVWEVETVSVQSSDHILLYTDGVSDVLANSDGDASGEIVAAIGREPRGGGFLLDAIVEDVHRRLAGDPQSDDLTMLTALLR